MLACFDKSNRLGLEIFRLLIHMKLKTNYLMKIIAEFKNMAGWAQNISIALSAGNRDK